MVVTVHKKVNSSIQIQFDFRNAVYKLIETLMDMKLNNKIIEN